MSAVISEEFDIHSVHLRKPRVSKNGNTQSSHACKKYKFQLGEQDDMKCVLTTYNKKGALLKITDGSIAQFIHDFEAYVTDYLYDKCEEWFGRKLDRADVKRMLCSVINRDDEFLVQNTDRVKAYLLYDDNTVEQVQLEDREITNRKVVPIIEFKGLFINKRIFSPCFYLTSILVGKEYHEENAVFFDPQSMLNRDADEDLENPHEGFQDCGFEVSSSHSDFDTKVWRSY